MGKLEDIRELATKDLVDNHGLTREQAEELQNRVRKLTVRTAPETPCYDCGSPLRRYDDVMWKCSKCGSVWEEFEEGAHE